MEKVVMDNKIKQIIDQLAPVVKSKILSWLDGPYDENTKKQIIDLLEKDLSKINDAFYKKLDFGTGGIRALMGVGTNRLNNYTIQTATQGLANYLLSVKPNKKLSVVIGYDNRNNSKEFAMHSARVLAGNGILTYVFDKLRPTPYISFACRFLKCDAAIMITASHNAKEYNGYKVYWDDGGQILPPHDTGIIEKVNEIISPSQTKLSKENDSLIKILKDEIDPPYFEKVTNLQLNKEENQEFGKELKVIYSNLHGTGITTAPTALKDWGFSNVSFVEKQKTIDGNFTCAPSPNPEEKKALLLGIEQTEKEKADLFIATDPDADRMAVAINHNNEAIILTGNQIACLLVEHICSSLTKANNFEKNSAFVKSIVTTELFANIVKSYDGNCFDVLTGFKYIAQKILLWEEDKSYKYIFGAEESYGYLYGTFVRDKDATIAACLICELALIAKRQQKTLIDLLSDIYKKHGIYREDQLSIKFEESQIGMKKMQDLMTTLRKAPPKTISNCEVAIIEDYQTKKGTNINENKTYDLTLPNSNVLIYYLSDKSKIVIRPSGTEPKIKIYISVFEKTDEIEKGVEKCDFKINAIKDSIKSQLVNS
jgi:phosphomannomutase